MKKTIIALFALVAVGYAAEGKNIIVKTYHTCGGTPHAGGPSTYDYVHQSPTSVQHVDQYTTIYRKSITCEDPGANGCVIAYLVPNVDIDQALPYAETKIANGILVGEYNPNGTPNDGDPFNQDLAQNPYFTWQATSPTCVKIEVYHEEN